jgi:hypothetical protein
MRLAISGESEGFGVLLLFAFPSVGVFALLILRRLQTSTAPRVVGLLLMAVYLLVPTLLLVEEILRWLGLFPA